MRPTRRSDGGTTTIELALIVVLMLTIALGALDFGLWVFQRSEAEQAAREASRIAMIKPQLGTLTSGPIFDAARAELSPGQDLSVEVTCSTNECAPGDTITVEVGWDRNALTFVGIFDQISGSSSRTVVGLPS